MHSSFDCTLIQKNCIEPKLLTYCLLQTRTLPSNKNKQRLLEFSRSPEWAFFASGNNCCHAVQVAPPKFERQGVQIGISKNYLKCHVKFLSPLVLSRQWRNQFSPCFLDYHELTFTFFVFPTGSEIDNLTMRPDPESNKR